MITRRQFIQSCITFPAVIQFPQKFKNRIFTVNGAINPTDLGKTLSHEHVLVDFIGADKISPSRWKHDAVIKKVLPYLSEMKAKGFKSIVECTPAFIGRDVRLLQKLSEQSGLHILTNTGYYGASDNKYLPKWAFTESAEQLAEQWINEFKNGIDGTSVKPGFIKTGVNSGALSELHQKLIKAAALTHLKTGLTICSHTGPALPAYQELDILKSNDVHPSAFVWVHASGSDEDFIKIGKMGCWISLDGIGKDNLDKNEKIISLLKADGLLNQVLISHDAGWYKPGEPDGGEFKGFTTIPDKFVPLLKTKGFSEKEINQLLIENPTKAFTIKVRTL